MKLEKLGLPLGLFFGLAGSLLSTSAQAQDDPTQVFEACTEGNERIRFADSIQSASLGAIKDVMNEDVPGPQVFQLGARLLQTEKNPELREIAEYLKARAYYRAKLPHLAFEKFDAFLSQPMTPQTPVAARMAAVECIVKIQKQITPLGFSKTVTDQMSQLMSRKELTQRDREILAYAFVVRAKQLVNQWDPAQMDSVLKSLSGFPYYLQYAQALVVQRHGQYMKALPLWEKIIEKDELPKEFKEDRDTILIMYARDLYEAKLYDRAGDILRKVPRDSNYLAQALSDLSWSLLMAGKRREAIGAAFNIQKSLLTRVYAPEAPLVASIALHEMCQYARALKNAVFFKKKYLPVLLWYRKLTPEQQSKPYQLLTQALRKKSGVPNVVLLEWLRSPEYRSFQNEANQYFDEKKTAYRLYSERLNAQKYAAWVKEWKAPLPKFYNQVDQNQKQITKKMNSVLGFLTQRITKQVAKMNENVQMLEIEIFDAAGEDMVWRNVNPEYQAWLDIQPDEKRPKDLYWEWGAIPVDPKSRDEVWEDELGWTLGNVSDECMNKKKFKEFRSGTKAASVRAQ